ncbi:TIR domain-containing protein [Dactylosporangium sucinum]|uniref:TIR domain-containing protein n=1 Tax=Dactylosporangium sucinum TaxID=1424081 RepID=UPI00167CC8BD|nr:TIR domain-containing protein [Dactylosporangium sucinum]
MTDVGKIRYSAFISYSRTADGDLAPALQQGLQQFAKPWNRLRALRVFRDDANLSANPGLWTSLQSAMDGAEYFILLASPEAAASEWVEKEVRHWLAHKPADHILIALTDGDLRWAGDDFDRAGSPSLPPALFGAFVEEPRWVDLRDFGSDQLRLQLPAFRDKVADLAAPLHGLPKDEMLGEDVNQYARTRRLVRGAAAVLVTLTLLASAAAVVAIVQQREARAQQRIAEEQQRIAQEQQRIAVSRQLAAQAESLRTADPRTALRLGVAARAIHADTTTDASLLQTLTASRYRATVALQDSSWVTSIAYSRDGKLAAVLAHYGQALLYEVADDGTFRQVGEFHNTSGGGFAEGIAFSPDGRTLVIAGLPSSVWDITDPAHPQEAATISENNGDGSIGAVFIPGTSTLVLGGSMGTFMLYDLSSPRDPKLLSETGTDVDWITAVALDADGDTLAIGGLHGELEVWNIGQRSSPTRLVAAPKQKAAVRSLGLTPSGADVVASYEDGTVVDWYRSGTSFTRGPTVRTATTAGVTMVAVPNSTSTMTALAEADGSLTYWDLVSSLSVATRLETPRTGTRQLTPGSAGPVTLAPSGRTFASGGNDSGGERIVVWDVVHRAAPAPLGWSTNVGASDERQPALRTAARGSVLAIDTGSGVTTWLLSTEGVPTSKGPQFSGHDPVLSPDGKLIATSDGKGTVTLSSMETGTSAQVSGFVAAFSTDGGRLVTDDGVFDIGDPMRPRSVGAPLVWPSTSASASASASADEDSGGDGTRDPTTPVLVAADGRTILSADSAQYSMGGGDTWARVSVVGDDGVVRHVGRTLRADTDSPGTLALSPDGRTLTLANASGAVTLYDLTGPSAPAPFGEPIRLGGAIATGEEDGAVTVAFSQDSAMLAVAGPDSVTLWSIADRERPRVLGTPFTELGGPAVALAFSAEDRTLFAADEEGRIVGWSLAAFNQLRRDPSAQACALTGRGLEPGEWARYVTGVAYRETC